MAGGALGDDSDGINDINVTPFVDVTLVLLIIFMVTASYITNQAIPVNLPEAASGESPPSKNVAFVITKDSELFLDGQATNFSSVSDQIAEIKSNSEAQVQVLISADQETPHGTVVKLIDIVRRNGIIDFAINIDAPAQ
jgi:Biopolymer transport protein